MCAACRSHLPPLGVRCYDIGIFPVAASPPGGRMGAELPLEGTLNVKYRGSGVTNLAVPSPPVVGHEAVQIYRSHSRLL